MEGCPLPPGSGLGEEQTEAGGSKEAGKGFAQGSRANCPGEGALAVGVEGQWVEGVLGSGYSIG